MQVDGRLPSPEGPPALTLERDRKPMVDVLLLHAEADLSINAGLVRHSDGMTREAQNALYAEAPG